MTDETTTDDRTPTQILIDRITAHDAEGSEIAAEMTRLGLDKKGVKAIVKATEQAAAAKKTLDALMGL